MKAKGRRSPGECGRFRGLTQSTIFASREDSVIGATREVAKNALIAASCFGDFVCNPAKARAKQNIPVIVNKRVYSCVYTPGRGAQQLLSLITYRF